MPGLQCEFEASIETLKLQRASRRASSLSKDKAEYKKRASMSPRTRKASAGPVGSDFATPHRAARVAIRTSLAKGKIASSSDMPQISMGHAGSWTRWVQKPSVSKCDGLVPFGELHVDESFIDAGAEKIQVSVVESDQTPIAPPEDLNGSCTSLHMDFNDQMAFPALSSAQTQVPQIPKWPKPEPEVFQDMQMTDVTPEKVSHIVARDKSSEKTTEGEPMEDWVVVSSDEASKAADSLQMVESFDAQHPRNMFAKKTPLKLAMPKDESEEPIPSIDWSKAGTPTEWMKRLIRGSANAAHHGLNSDKKAATVPLHALRAQNIGSSKRQKSTPRTPRSQSKPRAPSRC